LALQPTEVLIFGNPRGGTSLMQASRTIGLDLPLRVLVWQDADTIDKLESLAAWHRSMRPTPSKHRVIAHDRRSHGRSTSLGTETTWTPTPTSCCSTTPISS
jgi:hypothetical protein